MAIIVDDLIVIGSRFQTVAAATERVYLPILSLVLGTKSCLETGDLEISETRSRLTKYVGY